MNLNELREQNRLLKQKIHLLRNTQIQNDMRQRLDEYKTKLENTIEQLNHTTVEEEQVLNTKLHKLTGKYQSVLKEQIELLTENKSLSQKKDLQDQTIKQQISKLTNQYESQISQYEQKVKHNVKKLQQIDASSIIKKLIQNDKFKDFMAQRGCNLQALQKQSQLQQAVNKLDEMQKQIEAAQMKSDVMDEEIQKIHSVVQTMKQVMENMQNEKKNILKQNNILKEKLSQSEEIIGKLLGTQQTQNQQQQQSNEELPENQNKPNAL